MNKTVRSELSLIFLGVAWLVLGGVIFTYQYNRQPTIVIEWQTESEYNTAGFNVYRSADPAGEFVQINSQLIPSQGDTTSGASYQYEDTQIEWGQLYYYKLEDVEYSNVRQQHDVISDKVEFEWWVLLLVAVSLLIGLILLSTGIRGLKTV